MSTIAETIFNQGLLAGKTEGLIEGEIQAHLNGNLSRGFRR